MSIMSKNAEKEIFTIGHSTRSLAEFLGLLKEFGIEAVADVRRFPSSKKFPHFNREELEKVLGEEGIEYIWFEPLGGFRGRKHRPGKCLKAGGFAAYKEHLLGREAKQAFKQLLQIAAKKKTAIMCAERFWWRCHRIVLGEELKKGGWRIIHIIEENKTGEQKNAPLD